MKLVMQIAGLATGAATPFDGQFLKDYDPDRPGRRQGGVLLFCHIEFTRDKTEAKKFEDLPALHAEWTRVSKRVPTRPDGKPNRPLTAFNLMPMSVED